MLAAALALGGLIPLGLTGCSNTPQQPDATPPAAYTGPAYLKGTVGSLTQLRNDQPLPVSGYGLVVGLDGTGSRGAPSYIRQQMLDRMRKLGVGSARYQNHPFGRISPERLLSLDGTAVVAVRGLIPPVASEGSRFDVVVSALQGTQTTSLVGGRLLTTNLGVRGLRPNIGYIEPLAKAEGNIYINPSGRHEARQNEEEFVYHALVVAGGETTRSRQVRFVLNQPSWPRSQAIADRINERFPASPDVPYRTAQAQNDVVIRLNVPRSYADRPTRFVRLVRHFFIQRADNFALRQAQRLTRALKADPERAASVALAWQALGKTIIPVLRRHYQAEAMTLRMAALEAGAALEDERTTQYLRTVAEHADPAVRRRVAEILLDLPESTRGAQILKKLLSDPKRSVRIVAYESLAAMNDPILGPGGGGAVRNSNGDVKYSIDLVPSDQPLIYITQERTPRIAIFQPTLSFKPPFLAQIWDNDFMLRGDEENDKKMKVFYKFDRPPEKTGSETFQRSLNVARLIKFLGHEPTMDRPENGLGLSYSRTVDAVYQLAQQGAIDAPIEVHVSELAKQIEDANERLNPRRPAQGPGAAATTQRRPVRAPASPDAADRPKAPADGAGTNAPPAAAAGSPRPGPDPARTARPAPTGAASPGG